MPHATRRAIVDGRREANRTLPRYLTNKFPTTWEGFEASGDWTPGAGATVTEDVTHVKQGTKSLNLAGNGANIYMQRTISWVIPPECKSISFWIWVDDATKITSVIVYLSNRSDLAFYYQMSPSATGFVNGWNFIERPLDTWAKTGTITWADTMIALRVRMNNTAETNISLDDFQVGLESVPAIVLRFDDGWDSGYAEGFAYANRRRMRLTQYLIPPTFDTAGHVTTAQVSEMYRSSCDIANHSITSDDFTTLTQGQIETNLSGCAAALAALGVGDSRLHVAYPSGGFNADSDAAMAATGMLTGTTTVPGSFYMWNIEQQAAWYRLPAYGLNDPNNFTSAKGVVDDAKRYGKVQILMTHKIAPSSGVITFATLSWKLLLDYIASLNIPVLTMTDIWALRDGPISVPNYPT